MKGRSLGWRSALGIQQVEISLKQGVQCRWEGGRSG